MHEGSAAIGHAIVAFKAFLVVYLTNMYLWCFDGISSWPIFGLGLAEYGWEFDWDLSQLGLGVMLGVRANLSILYGAILFHGIVEPWELKYHNGDCATWSAADTPWSPDECPYWYDDETVPTSYVGHKCHALFCGLGIMVADGAFTIIDIFIMLGREFFCGSKEDPAANDPKIKALDDLFLGDKAIPTWITPVGFLVFGTSCVLIVQFVFNVVWYQTIVAICFIPFFAVAIMQGMGLSDWNVSSSFGKLLMFLFGAWNASTGEVIPSLALCMVTKAGCSAACDLMQDFKTGYLLGAKPSQMFYAQVFGACCGIFIVPACFVLLNTAYEIPSDDGPIPGIYGPVYRILAIVTMTAAGGESEGSGEEGAEIPKMTFEFMFLGAAAALTLNIINKALTVCGCRESCPAFCNLVPLPMCIAIGILIPAGCSLEMFMGGIIASILEMRDPVIGEIKAFVAGGSVLGGGIAVLCQVFIVIAGGSPPMTVAFGGA